MDGRVFSQAYKMTLSPYHCVLVLEGSGSDLKRCQMSRQAIQGAIMNITLLRGIPVLRSKNIFETLSLMCMAAKQRVVFVNKGIERHGRRPKNSDRRKLYILQGIPSVGPQRSLLLLEHFGSVEKIMCAKAKELRQVCGIGFKTARIIRTLLS